MRDENSISRPFLAATHKAEIRFQCSFIHTVLHSVNTWMFCFTFSVTVQIEELLCESICAFALSCFIYIYLFNLLFFSSFTYFNHPMALKKTLVFSVSSLQRQRNHHHHLSLKIEDFWIRFKDSAFPYLASKTIVKIFLKLVHRNVEIDIYISANSVSRVNEILVEKIRRSHSFLFPIKVFLFACGHFYLKPLFSLIIGHSSSVR